MARVALVTGGQRGIGAAISEALQAAGRKVVASYAGNDQAAEAFTKRTGIPCYKFDVADYEACATAMKQIEMEVGPVEILVNNAGIIIREGIDSPKVTANLGRTMDVNVMGTFHPIQAWLKSLRATRGTIVNVASIASTIGIPGVVGYSPSKGAVKQLTQALAVELAKDGVRVNAIAPGVIETPMTATTRESPEKLARFMSRTPMARVGQPEELIGPVVFLASPMASYVTGVTLPVDGGFLAA